MVTDANKSKKYEILLDTKTYFKGRVLYRIRALKDFADVKAGDLGGYIQRERNLSQEGNCWVYDDAKVHNGAQVYDNAKVYGSAIVCGFAEIYDNAEVGDNAKVFGYAGVCAESKIGGNAEVFSLTGD